MDLYEALKAGTSAEELLKTFHRDLDEANARIAAEKEEENIEQQKYLAECREDLADAILAYAEACFGKELNEDEMSIESIEEVLIQFEKEIKNILELSKRFNKILEKTKNEDKKIKITTHNFDDDIIAQFLESLK